MSQIFAYCRISTLDQTTENQRREIESAGFKIKPQQIIEEHISGSAATSERPMPRPVQNLPLWLPTAPPRLPTIYDKPP